MEHKCKLYIVSGIVQGVGFRYFTREQAIRLNLQGYAKNLSNGDVEVLAVGGETNVLALGRWLEKGPKTAVVNGVESHEGNVTTLVEGFEIL